MAGSIPSDAFVLAYVACEICAGTGWVKPGGPQTTTQTFCRKCGGGGQFENLVPLADLAGTRGMVGLFLHH